MNLVEIGEYTGIFKGIEFGKSPKTGTPTIATKWFIEELDVERTVFTYLTKASMTVSFKKLESIGFNGDFENPGVTVEKTSLRCVHDVYEGKPREKWDFAQWGGGGIVDADKKTTRDLNAMWKKEMGPGASKKPVPAPKPKPLPAAKPASAPAVEAKASAAEDDLASADLGDSGSMSPREIAWDMFIQKKASPEAIEGLENDKTILATKEWSDILEKAIPSKDELDFTDEDWDTVRAFCEAPF